MIRPMLKTLLRWTFPLVALFVVGPAAGLLIASLRDLDGGTDATPLTSALPMMGLVVGLGVLALAGVLGAIAARLVGLGSGMTVTGFVLAWAAWRTGNVERIVLAWDSDRPLWRLAIEGAILGVAGVGIALGLCAVSRDRGGAGARGRESDPSPLTHLRDAVLGEGAPLGLAVALVGGGVGAWLVAVSGLKGQTIWAALLGVLLGTTAARVAEHRTPVLTFFIAIAVLATLGPISGEVMASTPIVDQARRGTIFALALPTPLDWLAGAFLGVPIGLGWAAAMSGRTEA